jgi:hypothetical protein
VDVDRFRQFSSSGIGRNFTRNQAFLQQTNAFSETRIYNYRSLLNSVRRQFPVRHSEININFRNNNGGGTRTSNYAFAKGGAPYGLLRFETGNNANSIFKTLWGIGQGGGTSGGLHEPFDGQDANTYTKYEKSKCYRPMEI